MDNSAALISTGFVVIWILLLVALVIRKMTTAAFVAATLSMATIWFIAIQGDRISEISTSLATIKIKEKEAIDYTKQIREIRDRLTVEEKNIHDAAINISNVSNIVKELAGKNVEAGEKLGQMDEQLTQGQKAITKLDEAGRFVTTFIAALNDDRKAYDALAGLAADDHYPRQDDALRAVAAIKGSMSGLILTYAVPWHEGVNPSKFSLDNLTQQYLGLYEGLKVTAEVKIAYVQYISNRSDFRVHDRLQFLIDVMRHSPSIKVVAHACDEFAKLSGYGKLNDRTNVTPFEDWWEKHASDFH